MPSATLTWLQCGLLITAWAGVTLYAWSFMRTAAKPVPTPTEDNQ